MNIDAVLDVWEGWWTRQNDQPIIHAIFQQGDYEAVLPWKKDWMSPGLTNGWSPYSHEQLFGQALQLHLRTGEDRYMTEIIEYQARVARLIGHAGEGYSFIHPGFGPFCLEGFISGQARFHDTTIWFGRESSCSWEEIDRMYAGANAYAEAARRWLPELIRGVQEHYVIAIPDFGDGLDSLSALRRPEDIMFDTVDDPERVKHSIERVHRCWEEHDPACGLGLQHSLDPRHPVGLRLGEPAGARSAMGHPLHQNPRLGQADQPLRRAAHRGCGQTLLRPLPESGIRNEGRLPDPRGRRNLHRKSPGINTPHRASPKGSNAE